MPVKRYVSINGRLRGEITAGVRTDYLTDAIGSITGTVDEGGKVINTYRYKPYGGRLAKTGTGADPSVQWTGDTGSRVTNLNRAEQYNVHRHYGTQQAAWTSVDPLWPSELAFVYVGSNPVCRTDRLGLNFEDCPPEFKDQLQEAWRKMSQRIKGICPDPNNPSPSIIECWRRCGDNAPERNAQCRCKHGSGVPGFPITIRCKSGPACVPMIQNRFSECNGACICTEAGTFRSNCKTTICLENCTPSQIGHWDEAFLHELMHCCNARHKFGTGGDDLDEPVGVPGPGGPGANVLCLLNCIRPILGLPKPEPWINPLLATCGRGPWHS
ncbi:MAG TPA: RHS repeat-associated core domain-containing protein [Fimbriimonadaceae bacterium]|nr:RHS repeat-associated core domain-containing protein [Fimbriimonadaceae bacterium]